ncbi:unnamed protein product [Gadus morhua 'NCC']
MNHLRLADPGAPDQAMIALKCEEMGDKRKGSTSAQTHRNSAIAITPKLPPRSGTSIIISCTTGVVRLAGGPPQKTPEIPTAESSVSYAAAARKLGFCASPTHPVSGTDTRHHAACRNVLRRGSLSAVK